MGKIIHGHTTPKGTMSPTYKSWAKMKERCLNKNCKDYPNYGGKGIVIYPPWLQFVNFLKDMGVKPEGLELDRIDYNGDYIPTNCRWATEQVQAENRSWTKWVHVNGRKVTMKEAARILGLKYGSLKQLTSKKGRWGIPAQEAVERLMVSKRS